VSNEDRSLTLDDLGIMSGNIIIKVDENAQPHATVPMIDDTKMDTKEQTTTSSPASTTVSHTEEEAETGTGSGSEKVNSDAKSTTLASTTAAAASDTQSPTSHLYAMVRKIPDDNSCLFHAIAYVCDNRSRDGSDLLRQISASIVASDPTKFNEAMLGMPNNQYVQRLLDPLKWGGAVEVELLSGYYATEICVHDIQTSNTYSYGGEMNYKSVVFLLYNGIHYDCIVGNIEKDGRESQDVVTFDPSDQQFREKAHAIAKEFKAVCYVCSCIIS
jgi:OTU-like cysteine protease